MKKISLLFLIFALTVLAILPCVTYAASDDSDGANLRFINPVAVSAIGDTLFVADNVTSDQGVILCFDISDDAPHFLYRFSLDSQAENLSVVNNQLCVIYSDKFELREFDSENGTLEVHSTYSNVGAKDVTYGYHRFLSQTIYFLGALDSNDRLYYYDTEELKFTATENSLTTSSPAACATLGNNIYFLYDGTCKCYNGSSVTSDNYTFADGLLPFGMFTYTNGETDYLAVFDKTSVYYMNGTAFNKTHVNANTDGEGALDGYSDGENEKSIADITFSDGKMFVLNSFKQIDIFNFTEDKFIASGYRIGTDTIKLSAVTTEPSADEFTGFTLAKSSGYPTNIIYMTEFENSIDEIKTDYYDEFIIVDFEGSDALDYYYVLVGDKFGWVTKSDGATCAENDKNIVVTETDVSSQVTYTAEFLSLNAVQIYNLPISDIEPADTFNQTIDNPQTAKVLQKFTETKSDDTTVDWYYIAYGDNFEQYGFIQTANIGHFTASGKVNTDGEDVIGNYKINASLFEAVRIYATSDMNEGEALLNEAGGEIKLYSGDFIKVLKEKDGTSYIEVPKNDGNNIYGWIDSSYIIGRHAVTTNAVVGISILSVAVVLAVVLAIIFTARKKRSKSYKDDE